MPNTITTKFVGETCLEMADSGISIELAPGEFVYGDSNLECSGWFNHLRKEFKVAMGHEGWLSIYAHGYPSLHSVPRGSDG